MEKLNQLISANVYSVQQLKELGWPTANINDYCKFRNRKWSVGTMVFRQMFSNLGLLFIHKEYDEEQKNMKVIVYEQPHNNVINIIAQSNHVDPLFALAECAKILEKEDDFISVLLQGLKL